MPKGVSRNIFIEFMIDVTIFCNNSEFGFEQTSAILGMYYMTHKYFTDHLYVCPEDVLAFFKDFVMRHSVSVLIFSTQLNFFTTFFFFSFLRHMLNYSLLRSAEELYYIFLLYICDTCP